MLPPVDINSTVAAVALVVIALVIFANYEF